jgi:uncharacterized protein (DUF2267 family)
MNYDDFTGAVVHRARLGSTGVAVKAIRATLETLAERLQGEEAEHVAAQLPEEIGFYMQRTDRSKAFTLREFFERVAEREGVDLPDAIFHTRAVMSAVQDAVSAGELADVRVQLPDEFAPLFEAGATGDLNVRAGDPR